MPPSFPNASSSFRSLNPDLFGHADLRPQNSKLPRDRANDGENANDAVRGELESGHLARNVGPRKAKEADSRRFLVRVTSVRRILLDQDNLCEKYVVDCCRYAGLIPGDRPGQTQIATSQRKVDKGEEEHTEVVIYQLHDTGIIEIKEA